MKKYVAVFYLLFLFDSLFSQNLTKNIIYQYSTSSCFVTLNHNHKLLGNATGFFLKAKSSIYFITNNHVAGAEYALEEHLRLYNKPLPADSIPDTLSIRNYGEQFNYFNYLLLPVNKNAKPNYFKFYSNEGDNNSLLDVIAFKIDSSDYDKIKYNTILDSSLMSAPLFLTPGDELFVVGFPRDYGYTNLYPIWKRGTIASEPAFQNFLIDATTRGGMSGSPVYFKNNSYFESPGGYNTGSYTLVKLIGIYSAQSYETELGNIISLDPVLKKLLKSN